MPTSHRYVVREIPLPVSASDAALPKAVAETLRVSPEALADLRILRKSLDARARNRPLWRYAVEFSSDRPLKHPRLSPADGEAAPEGVRHPLPGKNVAIVGSGPAGLAAALGLARKGYAVTVFEMGKGVVPRFRDIRRFIKQNAFDAKSNVLFGLGGAGTFSDGKLTARTRNPHTDAFLAELAICGADESILYFHHPHLGTDKLQFIIDAFRVRCEEAGAVFRFDTEVTDFVMEKDPGGARCAGVIANGEVLRFDAVVLAPGLSAHDLYVALEKRGVAMERKGFSVGVRVEHPQDLINKRQLGDQVDTRLTGAAEYFLTWQNAEEGPKGRAAYSFCMCPGGVVIPCADRPDALFTNGMSYSNRASAFANSAVVATVDVDALPGGVLAGMEYQQQLERDAFRLGGGDFTFPIQTIAAFMEQRLDTGDLPRTTFQKPMRWVNLWELFTPEVAESLRDSFREFDRKIPGFIAQGLMIAPESRTSSPVRLPRDPVTLASANTAGLYPIGEGAGFSGGIVSSGADGFRLADAIAAYSESPHAA